MRLAVILACAIGIAATAAGAEPVEARARAHVPAPPERVFAVLADFESWDRVFRSVDTVRVERLGGRRARIGQVARRAGRRIEYTLLATVHRKTRRLELRLDPDRSHDLAVLQTTWQVIPGPDGGSLVSLRVVTASGFPVPSFLEQRIAEATTHASLNELVQALGAVVVTDSHDDAH